MSLVTLAREGYCVLLDALLDGLVPVLHLYTNDPDLDEDTEADDFDEADWEGYAPQTLQRWTPASLREGRAFSSADPLTFAWYSGETPDPVQGYYVTAGEDGCLLWAWRRPGAAFAIGPDNPQLVVYVEALFPPEASGDESPT